VLQGVSAADLGGHSPVDASEIDIAPVVRGGETVLVVEDEASLRRLAERVLGGLGYRALVVGSGDEALDVAAKMASRPICF